MHADVDILYIPLGVQMNDERLRAPFGIMQADYHAVWDSRPRLSVRLLIFECLRS